MGRKPDWEGFGRAVMENWPEGDLDGFALQDAAKKFGVIVPVDGGFDPEKHSDVFGCAEPGDPWFLINFPTVRKKDPTP